MGKEGKKENEQVDPVDNGSTTEIAKINAIRDIIFGTDMAEYNQQFDSLKQLINHNKSNTDKDKNELLDKIQQLENNLKQSMQSLEEKITTRLDDLQRDKTDRVAIGTLLEEIGKKIKQ